MKVIWTRSAWRTQSYKWNAWRAESNVATPVYVEHLDKIKAGLKQNVNWPDLHSKNFLIKQEIHVNHTKLAAMLQWCLRLKILSICVHSNMRLENSQNLENVLFSSILHAMWSFLMINIHCNWHSGGTWKYVSVNFAYSAEKLWVKIPDKCLPECMQKARELQSVLHGMHVMWHFRLYQEAHGAGNWKNWNKQFPAWMRVVRCESCAVFVTISFLFQYSAPHILHFPIYFNSLVI